MFVSHSLIFPLCVRHDVFATTEEITTEVYTEASTDVYQETMATLPDAFTEIYADVYTEEYMEVFTALPEIYTEIFTDVHPAYTETYTEVFTDLYEDVYQNEYRDQPVTKHAEGDSNVTEGNSETAEKQDQKETASPSKGTTNYSINDKTANYLLSLN